MQGRTQHHRAGAGSTWPSPWRCSRRSAMATIVGLIVTSVLMRQVVNAPLHFTEEVVGLLMSVCAVSRAAAGDADGTHVRVSILATICEDRPATRPSRVVDPWRSDSGRLLPGWSGSRSRGSSSRSNRNLRTRNDRAFCSGPWMMALPVSVGLTAADLSVAADRGASTSRRGRTRRHLRRCSGPP